MELITPLLPFQPGLRLDLSKLDIPNQQILMWLSSTHKAATCPSCGEPSSRIHSHYTRTVLDLPWADWMVRRHLNVRKFRCLHPKCLRSVFCERLSSLVAPWGRKTLRLADEQRQIGFALGGAAGERLCSKVRPCVSRNTLLRLVRSTPRLPQATPRVLGVDDYASRKGHSYGTILVNLEQGRPIELLPDREATTLAAWLEAHPGVEVIARDRAGAYADGATAGAPQAQQVADRFHLLCNVTEALKKVFEQHHALLSMSQAIEQPKAILPPLQDPAIGTPAPTSEVPPVLLTPGLPTVASRAKREKRIARYQKIHELHGRDWTISAIARHLKIDRRTVRRAVRADTFPEFKRPAKKLDPFKPYLVARWNEGCRTSTVLLEEIKQQGYQGQRTAVVTYLQRLRQAQGLPPRSRNLQPDDPRHQVALRDAAVRGLTPYQAALLVLRRPEKLEKEDKALLARLREADSDLSEAITLAEDFAVMLRERRAEQFDSWLERASESSAAVLRRLAQGFRRDYEAVKAGLAGPWSTGPVEGHINRLKMLKRQMYGRAKPDLLEKRLLHAA